MSAAIELGHVVLNDPNLYAHHNFHAYFKRFRAENPVYWSTGTLRRGFWSLFKYDDVMNLCRDVYTFSSQRNGVGLPTSIEEDEGLGNPSNGAVLMTTDPPFHIAMRKAYRDPFLPRADSSMESRARKLVAEIVDEVLPRGECDFAVDIANRLPMTIICEMMAIPREDWPTMYDWANMAMGHEDPEYQLGSSSETRRAGFGNLFSYTRKLAFERRGKSGSDLLTMLGNTRIDGQLLSEEQIGHGGMVFVIAGLETTRNTLAGGMLELIKNPAEMRKLRANRGLVNTAIEEFVRWTTPVTCVLRTATRDVEIRGKKIREGDRVVAWLASANRDEDAFPNADVFDVARTPNEHCGFLYGEHFCIGAHLARLQLRVMLEELLERMPDLELAGKVERLAAVQIGGIKHMPVRFTPVRLH